MAFGSGRSSGMARGASTVSGRVRRRCSIGAVLKTFATFSPTRPRSSLCQPPRFLSNVGRVKAPEICAEFVFCGWPWLVVCWPDEDAGEFYFDVVRADLPYIWRDRAVYSKELGL